MNPALRELFLLAAGVLAGLVGTAGGITSLVSYPALLLAGVAPVQANVANLVALAACWPGSAVASQPELRGQGRWLRQWGAVAALGGAAGSVLLLSTPPGVFARVVPFLVAAGSLALLVQPRITARRAARQAAPGTSASMSAASAASAASTVVPGASAATVPADRFLLPMGLVVLSAYNGYFGAGSGVLTLALLLLTTDPRLPAANALKNMVVGAATIASAVLFAVLTNVAWAAVAPLALGFFAGSLLGPRAARRLPPAVLRRLVALTGLALAVKLWLGP